MPAVEQRRAACLESPRWREAESRRRCGRCPECRGRGLPRWPPVGARLSRLAAAAPRTESPSAALRGWFGLRPWSRGNAAEGRHSGCPRLTRVDFRRRRPEPWASPTTVPPGSSPWWIQAASDVRIRVRQREAGQVKAVRRGLPAAEPLAAVWRCSGPVVRTVAYQLPSERVRAAAGAGMEARAR